MGENDVDSVSAWAKNELIVCCNGGLDGNAALPGFILNAYILRVRKQIKKFTAKLANTKPVIGRKKECFIYHFDKNLLLESI